MTIGGRTKELRRYYGLNQTDFGARLGLSQSAIAGYENDSHALSDQTIMHICKEYKPREEWLRSGEGPMFEDDADGIDDIAKQLNLNAFQTRLLRMIHDMTPEQQILVQQMAHQLAGDEPPEESDRDRTARIAREALAEYDRQQEEEIQDKRA